MACLPHLQAAAWRSWVAFVEQRRAKRGQLQLACRCWVQQRARAAFAHWREWHMRQVALRAKGEAVMRRWRSLSLAAALSGWRDFLARQQEKRVVLRWVDGWVGVWSCRDWCVHA